MTANQKKPNPRIVSDKLCKLRDDLLCIRRVLASWKAEPVYLVIGKSGMCYRKADGARTFLLDFPNGEAGPGCKPFSFDTIEEAEQFLDWLPAHRPKPETKVAS